ncbi:MAG: hypothetical protein ACI4TB_09730 [Lachnospiraceae bacterium]
MDIKAQISKIVDEITKDQSLMEEFQKNPVKVVEKKLGVDLPDDVVNKVIEGVKAKISVDKLSGAVDSLKKLF